MTNSDAIEAVFETLLCTPYHSIACGDGTRTVWGNAWQVDLSGDVLATGQSVIKVKLQMPGNYGHEAILRTHFTPGEAIRSLRYFLSEWWEIDAHNEVMKRRVA